jgi:PBP1b-binding outer membrane lipoprotein LpoB
MKKILPIVLIVLLLTGCKKFIEKKKEDVIVNAMTSGQWVVTSFSQNSIDITSSFSGYKFQYYSNNTVDAIKNNVVEKTGTWNGDAASLTISANFTNVVEPLSLLNGNWHIDNNSWTFVLASQNMAGDSRILRLDKL